MYTGTIHGAYIGANVSAGGFPGQEDEGSGGGLTPIALLTHTAAGSPSGTNTVTTGAIDTTGASILILSISDYAFAVAQALPSDSKLNIWTPLTTFAATFDTQITIYYAVNPIVGPGHTFTAAGSACFPTVCVAAFNQVVTTAPFDVQNGFGNASATTTIQPGSITPGFSNELIVTALCFEVSGGIVSIDSGFSITDQIDFGSGTNFGGALAYKVQTTAVPVNPTWTSLSSNLAASIAGFKHS